MGLLIDNLQNVTRFGRETEMEWQHIQQLGQIPARCSDQPSVLKKVGLVPSGTKGIWKARLPGALAGCRVLVVEDDYFLADDMKIFLSRAGADVIGPVPTLAAALAGLSGQLDAAVLDINLRGEPVWPLADALMLRKVPFIFATSYGPEVIPLAYAAIPHWVKPLNVEGLVGALLDLVEAM